MSNHEEGAAVMELTTVTNLLIPNGILAATLGSMNVRISYN